MTNNPDHPPVKSSSRLLIVLPLIVFLIFLILVLAQMAIQSETGQGTNVIPSALKDKPAPDFSLPPLEDSGVSGFSKDDLIGQVTLVNVWASWCIPCRQEHPIINQLAQDERFKVFGLNYKDKPANALAFLNELGNSFDAIGVDPKGRTGVDWGVYGVPETYVVDAKGIIRYRFVGPLTAQSKRDRLMPEIEKVLSRP